MRAGHEIRGGRVMKFVATGDWQLGMTAHFLDDEPRHRFQRARFDAVERIAEVVAEHDARFVVACGDVFESNQLDRRIIAQAFDALRAFDVPVVLVPGNHDPLDAASIYDSRRFTDGMPDHIHVLRSSEPHEVVPGVEVIGAPWSSKRPQRDLMAAAVEGLEPAPDGVVRILAGHGAVSTLSPDPDDPAVVDVADLRRALADGIVHAAVLGDRHSTTEVADRIWYPGAPEVTSRDEVDPGNVLVMDVTSDRCEVEKVNIGRWAFTVVGEELDSAEDVELLRRRLQGMDAKSRTAVWLRLRGTLSTAAHARLQEVLDEASELFAKLDAWERHTDLAVMPEDADFEALGLTGFARQALDDLESAARGEGSHSDADVGAAQDALALLYRFAGGAR